MIDFKTHIAECIALAEPVSQNPEILQDLKYYFAGENDKSGVALGAAYPSLNRADAYLFSLCYFDFDTDTKKQLIAAWYALIGYYLMIDDLEDLESDYEHREENAVIEAGLDDMGARSVAAFLDRCYETMSVVNPVMANRIDHKRQVIGVKQKIDAFLEKTKIR